MFRRLAVVLSALVAGVLLTPGPAQAHPLGNFSVNQLAALSFRPSGVDVLALADFAELPTVQEQSTVDSLGVPAYAARECAALASAFSVRVGGDLVTLAVAGSSFAYSDGSAGLRTSRLECSLSAAFDFAAGESTVDVTSGYRGDRVGWRELTAVASGVHLVDSPLPTSSLSDGLRSYPDDLLSSPPDVRSAHLRVSPGGATLATSTSTAAPALPGWLGRAESTLRGWVGSRDLTVGVGLAAVLLALLLGAAHAALPGHGKTVMAAYLAGRQGRPRDALAVGATVTLTHTGGVLVLGLLLTTAAGLAGETVLGWLGVTSGVLVATVGAAMLLSRRTAHAHGHSHAHSHGHPHAHAHGHDHFHDHGHSHGHRPEGDGHVHGDGLSHDGATHSHGHSHDPAGDDTHSHGPAGHAHAPAGDGATHSHDPAPGGAKPSRLAIVGMGIAGGLVPSPSALVVLLGAVGLGRTWFGVLLVLAYGLGMAAVLTAAGLLLIRVRDRWAGRFRLAARLPRLTRLAPTGTAAMVLLVGSALAIRSLVTL
ncbi:hypothetical protein KZZ52_40740 [Dactylosporangium sp. AC04546]|uniref:hypothetical protein n=1 Tax=Dactylosporangium sp. AC04546 TaxID=2862460 RepID=UPI001EDCAA6C|nr:hypothetical protein [Dactylosporangium sp. AC04546]WVK80273.1 hypothetical protein KZZ52_40740 [Dactylosporangium sp. AC04546]